MNKTYTFIQFEYLVLDLSLYNWTHNSRGGRHESMRFYFDYYSEKLLCCCCDLKPCDVMRQLEAALGDILCY